MSGFHYQSNCSPARTLSPQIRSTQDTASQYLAELLAERRKLGPFLEVLPICDRLLNQEIHLLASRISSERGYRDFDKLQYRSPSPMSSWNLISNINARKFTGSVGQEMSGISHGSGIDWQGAPASPSSYIVKKIICFEIPVAKFPNQFNFIGRLLGPKGNSLKRLESSTGCRVYIRGKGSIKDPEKEEKLRGKPGYEHLNDPLHILIEAEFPSDIVDLRLRQAQEAIDELLKPVDESQNLRRKQQLQELEMLDSSFIVDSPHQSGSVSPCRHNGPKHPNIWK